MSDLLDTVAEDGTPLNQDIRGQTGYTEGSAAPCHL